MIYYNNTDSECLKPLMEYIVANSITLKLGYESDRYPDALTDTEFDALVKKLVGSQYSFFCEDSSESVFAIVNNNSHRIAGYICGVKDAAYVREGTVGFFTPHFFIIDNTVYVHGTKVGRVASRRQIRHLRSGDLAVICIDSNTLCRCTLDGNILWRSPIPHNFLHNMYFDYSDYPTHDFPHGLVSISNGFEYLGKFMFYEDNGDFYGKIKVNQTYSKID